VPKNRNFGTFSALFVLWRCKNAQICQKCGFLADFFVFQTPFEMWTVSCAKSYPFSHKQLEFASKQEILHFGYLQHK
jgi:hypothetical protein